MKFFKRPVVRTGTEAFQTSATLVSLLFLIEFLEMALRTNFNHLGILPRTLHGLAGIIFSPFLHLTAAHLTANAFSLLILLWILFWDRQYHPEETLLLVWFLSGAGTWLIGRDSVHIGASSIVYGLVVYLIASGYWLKSWRAAIVALLVFFFYGGIFYGLFPTRGFVSWEGHLSGAIAGWWIARRFHG